MVKALAVIAGAVLVILSVFCAGGIAVFVATFNPKPYIAAEPLAQSKVEIVEGSIEFISTDHGGRRCQFMLRNTGDTPVDAGWFDCTIFLDGKVVATDKLVNLNSLDPVEPGDTALAKGVIGTTSPLMKPIPAGAQIEVSIRPKSLDRRPASR